VGSVKCETKPIGGAQQPEGMPPRTNKANLARAGRGLGDGAAGGCTNEANSRPRHGGPGRKDADREPSVAPCPCGRRFSLGRLCQTNPIGRVHQRECGTCGTNEPNSERPGGSRGWLYETKPICRGRPAMGAGRRVTPTGTAGAERAKRTQFRGAGGWRLAGQSYKQSQSAGGISCHSIIPLFHHSSIPIRCPSIAVGDCFRLPASEETPRGVTTNGENALPFAGNLLCCGRYRTPDTR
jgi:hypothetical protein